MRSQNSKVMTIANKLVAQGYNRANAMLKAWALVKLPLVESKVVGVTYGNRQRAIEHLSRYSRERVSIVLRRECQNPIDRNAVAVMAVVEGKGGYTVGYLPRSLSAFVAPLLDAGKTVRGLFGSIRGMEAPYLNRGLSIRIQL